MPGPRFKRGKWLLGGAIVIALVVAAAAVAWSWPPAPQGLDEFDPLVQGSIRNALRAARFQPWSDDRWLDLGMVYEANALPDLAVKCYLKVIQGDEANAQLWYRVACAQEASGDVEGAIASLDRVHELAPDEVSPWWRRGLWLLEAGDAAGAESAFERARAFHAHSPPAVSGLALCRLRFRQPQQALALIEPLVAQYPKEMYLRRVYAMALRACGRTQEALVQADRAGDVEPHWNDPWSDVMEKHRTGVANMLVTVQKLTASGRHTEAVQLLRPIYEQYPKMSAVTWSLAAALANAGELDAALDVAEAAVASGQSMPDALTIRGRVHHARREFEPALAAFEAAIEVDPTFSDAHLAKGQILRAMGRTREALVSAEAAARNQSSGSDASVLVAELLLELGHWREAAERFEHIASRHAANANAHQGLAEALFELGRLEEASASLQRAAELGAADAAIARLRQRLQQAQPATPPEAGAPDS